MTDSTRLVTNSQRIAPTRTESVLKVRFVQYGRHRRLTFGVEVKKVGGDTGYAGTENRDYCKANGIQTSFVKRGRPFGERKKTLSERSLPE